MKKYAISDNLTKQLFAFKSNSLNDKTNLQIDNTNETNKNETAHDKIDLNINSLRYKFDALVNQIKGSVNILVISETKPDETFPEDRFKIPDFTSHFRRDQNEFWGGIMVFVREDTPSKVIPSLSIEGIIIELNFRKKKWLLSCSYNPNFNTNTDHLEILRKNLDLYSVQYENLILTPSGPWGDELNLLNLLN